MDATIQRLKSRTYWVALIGAVLTVIEANYELLATFMPAQYRPYAPLILPLAMMLCREITTTALADK